MVAFSKSTQGSYSPDIFAFTSSWYKYDYRSLADAAEKAFGFFYGDYCGTRLLDAGFVFRQVREFWERNRYGMLPQSVISSWDISLDEASWFAGEKVYWEDDYTVSRVERSKRNAECRRVLIEGGPDQASGEKVEELCKRVRSSSGIVDKITFVKGVYVTVLASCRGGFAPSLDEEWRVARVVARVDREA